jgi:hypothetical protein
LDHSIQIFTLKRNININISICSNYYITGDAKRPPSC